MTGEGQRLSRRVENEDRRRKPVAKGGAPSRVGDIIVNTKDVHVMEESVKAKDTGRNAIPKHTFSFVEPGRGQKAEHLFNIANSKPTQVQFFPRLYYSLISTFPLRCNTMAQFKVVDVERNENRFK